MPQGELSFRTLWVNFHALAYDKPLYEQHWPGVDYTDTIHYTDLGVKIGRLMDSGDGHVYKLLDALDHTHIDGHVDRVAMENGDGVEISFNYKTTTVTGADLMRKEKLVVDFDNPYKQYALNRSWYVDRAMKYAEELNASQEASFDAVLDKEGERAVANALLAKLWCDRASLWNDRYVAHFAPQNSFFDGIRGLAEQATEQLRRYRGKLSWEGIEGVESLASHYTNERVLRAQLLSSARNTASVGAVPKDALRIPDLPQTEPGSLSSAISVLKKHYIVICFMRNFRAYARYTDSKREVVNYTLGSSMSLPSPMYYIFDIKREPEETLLCIDEYIAAIVATISRIMIEIRRHLLSSPIDTPEWRAWRENIETKIRAHFSKSAALLASLALRPRVGPGTLKAPPME
jgi:hypothetical protein